MGEGADIARSLKADLPQCADILEEMAVDFDGLEEDLAECDKSLARLNDCLVRASTHPGQAC